MATLHSPKPIILVADLASAGYGKLHVTQHTYLNTRECVDKGDPAWEHIFICSETGAERRWGLEKRTALRDYSKEGN